MKKTGTAVIGLGFGDEGKGRVVDWLCRSHDISAVVRFSGGQQAAHHVISGGTDHVFASFGSGTLAGVPTYVMRHCTIALENVTNELVILIKKGVVPKLRIDSKCPVTTHYDQLETMSDSIYQKNGSCGVGLGATWQREQDGYSLLAEDLLFPAIAKIKLAQIRKYYGFKDYEIKDLDEKFIKICEDLNDLQRNGVSIIRDVEYSLRNFINGSIVFEGSQGLLLDPKIGFFPHVTRSTIGLDNLTAAGYEPEVFLVTRAYQTRHGNGPMTNEHISHNIRPNPYEKNGDDGPQGKFRVSLLDVDLLKYAIMKEPYLSTNKEKLNLVITCLDLVKDEWRYTVNGRIVCHSSWESFVNGIADELNIDEIYISDSPEGNIERWTEK
jgi:adenylosuccinate synthase